MDKELKEKWLTALRSGEYKQAKHVLELIDDEHKVVGHCCIGVLARVAGLKSTSQGRTPTGINGTLFDDPFPVSMTNDAGAISMFSTETLKKLGLTSSKARTLAEMNDGDSDMPAKSFGEIADHIEEFVPVTP